MIIKSLSSNELLPILARKRNPETAKVIPKIPLDTLLINILEKANEFVPSASGSILLDDPRQKLADSARKELIFVCAFGEAADSLLGERISIERGIVGRVYRNGVAMVTNDTANNPEFSSKHDAEIGHQTDSILCVAIRVETSICGVIELINKKGPGGYLDSEKELLEIFAQYISLTIQGTIDAKKIEKMVRIDDLTGLSNDRYLHETLPQQVEAHQARGKPLSVIFLDLDRFKSINDRHGHLAGSQALAEFGRLLAKTVNDPEATLVRYGGDEFVILLSDTDSAGAVAMAEKIREQTEKHVFLSGPWGDSQKPLNLKDIVTTSIGVTTFEPVQTEETVSNISVKLLQHADRAMYDSKENNKNRVTVRPLQL